MTHVTFGVAVSPYVAVRALQQTAQDFAQDYPQASPHITQSFYVDNLLAAANTPEEASALHSEASSSKEALTCVCGAVVLTKFLILSIATFLKKFL